LVATATSLEELEKLDRFENSHTVTVIPSFGAKIVKIGPVDTEIDSFAQIKKRKKLRKVKYIAIPASLPSGLNSGR